MAETQERFGFIFPPDLRTFLQRILPISHGFPDWRDGRHEDLQPLVDRPADGVLFDVLEGVYWHPDWGERPSFDHQAMDIARVAMAAAPVLVPFHGHRYVQSGPTSDGSPVLSVAQTDIILYGNDIPGNLAREFGVPLPVWARDSPRRVPFWSDVVDWNNTPL